MAEIKNIEGRQFVDYMARDFDSLLQAMREQIPAKLPEWQDFESEADFGNVLLQLFAHMGDILSYYQDRIANESFLGTAQTRRSIIHHLSLIGYQLSTAAPTSTTLTLTVPADHDQDITINRGDAFATKSSKDKPSVHFEYTRETPFVISPDDTRWGQVEGNKKQFPGNPFEAGIPVEEGFLVTDEIIGQSDGSPNQHFTLAHPQLILRSLGQSQTINKDITLITELGETPTSWTLRESLAFSRENQHDFIIKIDDQDRAMTVFGDGAFGVIPPRGALIKATYRRGGGSQGNVAKDTIQTIIDAPQLTLIGAQVTNPTPATGGAERESIEHAVLHAPAVFRSFKRAVTAADYEALALDFKGVGKVRAEATHWNTVTLYVAPEGGGQVSDVLQANLLSYFEDKRPASTILEIKSVKYIKIFVSATIGVKSFFDPDTVTAQVQQTARDLLAFDNVDFRETIYLSKFYEALEALEGILFVNITEFRRADELPPQTGAGRLEIDVDQLPSIFAGKIELGENELPMIPNDPNDHDDQDEEKYLSGIKVKIEGER